VVNIQAEGVLNCRNGLGESLICDDPRLFVPTAWFGPTEAGSEKDPQAGCLFAFKPGVRDLPENRYAG
jgi:hypothetical protein